MKISTPRAIRLSILWSTLLIVLISAIGKGLEQVDFHLDFGEAKILHMMSLRDQQNDVVYLGNSICCQGVNPQVIDEAIGINSYNLALGGSSLTESELVLRHYCEQNHPPQLVVIGITPNRTNGIEIVRHSLLKQMSLSLQQLYKSRCRDYDIELSLGVELLNNIPIYSHRNATEHIWKYLIDGQSRVPHYIQGHLILTLSRPPPKQYPNHQATLNVKALECLLDYCKTKSISVVLYEPPMSESFNNSTTGRDLIDLQIEELLENYPSVKLLNMNRKAVLDKIESSDWVNLNHLNKSGASKFSRLFADELKPHIARLISIRPTSTYSR